MLKIDWIRKLSSRKFWALLAGLVISVMILFGAGEESTEKVVGAIGAFSSIAVYMIAEAKVDASGKDGSNNEL